MKKILFTVFLFCVTIMNAQEKKELQKTRIVEASCGQCQFGMKAKGCDLSVRIDGKTYFVDGAKLDDHGDAHAEDGFCAAIRTVEVVGEVKDDRFVASYFKLLPLKEGK